MSKKLFALAVLTLTISTLLLAGCSDIIREKSTNSVRNPIQEDSSRASASNSSNGIKSIQDIIRIASSESSSGGTANKVRQTSEDTKYVDEKNIRDLSIENITGNIILQKSSESKPKIHSKIKVDGIVAEEVNEILNNIEIQVMLNNRDLSIKAVTKDGKGDFWKWKSARYQTANVTIDYYIDLPEDCESYNIECITGDVRISGLKGVVDVQTITGNIDLNNMTLVDSSSIELITGNIGMNVNIDAASKLDVECITGNINLSIPRSSNADINASAITGMLTGNVINGMKVNGKSFSGSINNGGTDISLEVVTGNILVNKN